jgi:hypothetical protein
MFNARSVHDPSTPSRSITEEITVLGTAESMREAVKVKREADAIVDAIAAKDV